jgi:hypothetical protein
MKKDEYLATLRLYACFKAVCKEKPRVGNRFLMCSLSKRMVQVATTGITVSQPFSIRKETPSPHLRIPEAHFVEATASAPNPNFPFPLLQRVRRH